MSADAFTHIARIAAIAVAWFFFAEPVSSELRHMTAYRDNPIRGTTPAEVWRSMAARPIIDEDGPALANITHDHSLDIATDKNGKSCRVGSLHFTWRFVITLPKAVDEGKMSGQMRSMWREFVTYLKRHEEHHRTIFLGCGKDFVATAQRLTAGSCAALERKVRQFVDKQYDACMARQRAYDREERGRVANLALRKAYRK